VQLGYFCFGLLGKSALSIGTNQNSAGESCYFGLQLGVLQDTTTSAIEERLPTMQHHHVQIVALFATFAAFCFSVALLEIPIIRLVEQAICNKHFRSVSGQPPPLDEKACKIPEIQQRLGHLMGVKIAVDAIPRELFFFYVRYYCCLLITLH
jgi:hypothetical protein